MALTQARLRELFTYEPDTGNFIRNVSVPGSRGGTIAGCLGYNGYIVIRVDGKLYYAHRLAFLYMTGAMPRGVDHEKLNRSDNRWSKIRPATQSQNCANMPLRRDNSTGVKGATVDKCGRFRVRLAGTEVGRFETLREAKVAYRNAALKKYGKFANFGEAA